MICPNCGLDNPPGARFCGNCGTTLGGAAPPPPAQPPQGSYLPPSGQASQPYNMAGGPTRMSPGRMVGIGCLVILFLLFTRACVRSCFVPHRHYVYRVR